jgi:hypothetical protein
MAQFTRCLPDLSMFTPGIFSDRFEYNWSSLQDSHKEASGARLRSDLQGEEEAS